MNYSLLGLKNFSGKLHPSHKNFIVHLQEISHKQKQMLSHINKTGRQN